MSAVPIPDAIATSPAARPRRRLPRAFGLGLSRHPRRIWFFAIALNLLVAVTAIYQIVADHAGELARAEERTRLAATALKAHLERIFDLADANLKGLDETPDSAALVIDRGQPGLRARLAAQIASGRPFVNLLVVDASGQVTHGARADQPAAQFLGDRPYFLRHQADRVPGLLISPPVVSRPSGFLIVPISRRIETRSGAFDGIVVAGLMADHLIDLYRTLEPLSVTAHLLDGTTLARSPEGIQAGQRLAADDPLMQNFAKAPAGTFRAEVGDRGRIVSYASLDHWPVMVAVEINRDAALAPWRASLTGTLILALVFAATVIGAFVVIERQMNQLASARIAAEAADRAKSNFLAHMSHELRTPLNAVIGFAEIMSQEAFGPLGNPRYRQYVADIHKSGEHLLTTISSILDLARVSAGHWKIDQRMVSPAEVAADVCRQLAPEAEDRFVSLTVDVPPGLPTFLSDRRVLGQILLNLVSYAIRSTPDYGAVRIALRSSDAMLTFKIADSGSSMSREEIRQALEPFGAAASVLTTKARDAGLALPLARSFAGLLGGRLRIDSGPGRGAVATVVLPLGNISLSSEKEWRARRDSNS